MRRLILIIAATALGAAPAIAQNEAEPVANTDATATNAMANEVTVDTAVTNDTAIPTTTAVPPPEAPTEDAAPAPAPKSRSFPWGLLGLLGLIGLFRRRSRTD